MPDNNELFAQALMDAANDDIHSPFKNRDTAKGYWQQLYVVLNDINAPYPHGCAEEIITRIQELSGNPTVTVVDISHCQSLKELRTLHNLLSVVLAIIHSKPIH